PTQIKSTRSIFENERRGRPQKTCISIKMAKPMRKARSMVICPSPFLEPLQGSLRRIDSLESSLGNAWCNRPFAWRNMGSLLIGLLQKTLKREEQFFKKMKLPGPPLPKRESLFPRATY